MQPAPTRLGVEWQHDPAPLVDPVMQPRPHVGQDLPDAY